MTELFLFNWGHVLVMLAARSYYTELWLKANLGNECWWLVQGP